MEAAVARFVDTNHEVTRKIVETAQCRWLGDVQIVSDENPCLPPASQKVSKVRDNQTGAAVEQKGDRDVTGR